MEVFQLNHLMAITELLPTDRAMATVPSRFALSARCVKSFNVGTPNNA